MRIGGAYSLPDFNVQKFGARLLYFVGICSAFIKHKSYLSMKRPLLNSRTKVHFFTFITLLGSLLLTTCEKFDDTLCPSCPCILEVNPTIAIPGDEISIIGENFPGTTDDLIVSINNKPAEIVSVSVSEEDYDTIKIIVPIGGGSGNVKVTVGSLRSDDISIDSLNCHQILFILNPDVVTELGKFNMAGSFDGDTSIAVINSPYSLSMDIDNSAVYFTDLWIGGYPIRSFDFENSFSSTEYIETESCLGAIAGISNKIFGNKLYYISGVDCSKIYELGFPSANPTLEYLSSDGIIIGNMVISESKNALLFSEIHNSLESLEVREHILTQGVNSFQTIVSIPVPDNTIVVPVDMEEFNGAIYLSTQYYSLSTNSFSHTVIYLIHVDNGTFIPIFSSPSVEISSIALDGTGHLYASTSSQIFLITNNDRRRISGNGDGYKKGTLDQSLYHGITDIDIDENNKLWILDSGNHIIRSAQF